MTSQLSPTGPPGAATSSTPNKPAIDKFSPKTRLLLIIDEELKKSSQFVNLNEQTSELNPTHHQQTTEVTHWSSVLAATSEYCRVVWDLFTHEAVMTYAVATQNRRKFYLSNNIDEKLTNHPSFDKNLIDQSMNNNLNTKINFFMNYCSKRLISPVDCNTVMKKMLDDTDSSLPIRILLVAKLDKEIELKSFHGLFTNALNNHTKRKNVQSVSPVDISVVNLGKIDIEKLKVNRLYREIEYIPVECDDFAESLIKELILLVKKHYNLVMTSVSKIPMKEQEGAGKSTEYNVGLQGVWNVVFALIQGCFGKFL